MGRAPCCGDHEGLQRGPWTDEEDQKLTHYVQSHGPGNWRTLPKLAGLARCGKSCRLRWANYLRPDIKCGTFSMQEDLTIIRLHAVLGNKWSAIASHIPGRTDNEIKNRWNTKLRRRMLLLGIDPVTHMSLPTQDFMASSSISIAAQLNNALAEAQSGRLARDYGNISHVFASSVEHQYLPWQLSQILKLLGTHHNPVWAHPLMGSVSSISTDNVLQPDELRWLHSIFQDQVINHGIVSGQKKDDSNEHNAFSKELLQYSGQLEKISEGKKLPISTNEGNEQRIEGQPTPFDREITDWNSVPILMPSSNPDKINDHEYYYSDGKPSSTAPTINSCEGGSENVENSIHYHQEDMFGSAIRTSETMSLPSARTDLQEDESSYWADLLNSIDNAILI